MYRSIFAAVILCYSTGAAAQAGQVGGSGRFAIVHSPHTQKDTVLLDTATGKTWQLRTVANRTGEPDVWVPMARFDNAEEKANLDRNYPAAPAKPEAKNSN